MKHTKQFVGLKQRSDAMMKKIIKLVLWLDGTISVDYPSPNIFNIEVCGFSLMLMRQILPSQDKIQIYAWKAIKHTGEYEQIRYPIAFWLFNKLYLREPYLIF